MSLYDNITRIYLLKVHFQYTIYNQNGCENACYFECN